MELGEKYGLKLWTNYYNEVDKRLFKLVSCLVWEGLEIVELVEEFDEPKDYRPAMKQVILKEFIELVNIGKLKKVKVKPVI